jgi:hypothetical protein
MLLKEIIAVYSENHTKPINTFCGHSAELLNVKVGGTSSYHCALKCYDDGWYYTCRRILWMDDLLISRLIMHCIQEQEQNIKFEVFCIHRLINTNFSVSLLF